MKVKCAITGDWADRSTLKKFEDAVAADLRRFERLLHQPCFGPRRGRPRNEPRYSLANAVGWALQRHGVRLTKTRRGTFDCVLLRVIEAAEKKMPPDDLFPTIRETVDLFRYMGNTIDPLPSYVVPLLRPWRTHGSPDTELSNERWTIHKVAALVRPLSGIVRGKPVLITAFADTDFHELHRPEM
jgi:hypothetical protein